MPKGQLRISLPAIGLGLPLTGQQPSFDVASVKHMGSAIMCGPAVSPVMGCRYSGTATSKGGGCSTITCGRLNQLEVVSSI
jgi:hypothetical protein